MSDISSDDESNQIRPEDIEKIKPGMFVSGWDDPDNDIGIEEDENPHATLEREILWAASEEDKNYLVEEILLKDPNLVNSVDRDGYTPLHKASYNNNYELAQILLKYKADPNRKTEYHWTPLHSACKWNNAKVAALLLQNGSDINARSEGDQTPLHITTTGTKVYVCVPNITEWSFDYENVSSCRDTLVTLLMNPQMKPEILNNSSETAYQIAKRTGLSAPLFEMVDPALFVETGIIE